MPAVTLSTRVGASRRLTLVLACLLILSACASDDTYLPALLADPMASYEHEGLVLFDSWEYEEGRDIILDNPTDALVGRRYRIEDQSRAEEQLAAVASAAESEGWRIRSSGSDDFSKWFRAAKDLGRPGEGRLIVSLVAEDTARDPEGPMVLRLILDFGFVGFDSTTTSDRERG